MNEGPTKPMPKTLDESLKETLKELSKLRELHMQEIAFHVQLNKWNKQA